MIREPTSGRPRYGGRIADSVALEPVDAIVVGGGLAGLAAAGTIHAAGRSVRLIEASDGLGGRVRTDLVDGFRLDRGFQVLLTAYPELERQLDVGALDLASFEPGADVWQDSTASSGPCSPGSSSIPS
ncbi:MAG: FAD-dependent oxidoreductase [Ilumatobacteraceae bacterium]